MKVPLQLVFRNMRSSEFIRRRVVEKVKWLETFSSQIMSCRVSIEKPHQHHMKGNLYHVRIDLRLPGDQILMSRTPDQHHAFKDVYVCIQDAFDRARREIEEYERKRRRDVKKLQSPAHAFIVALFHEEEQYGFIQSEEGREIYFNRNSLLNERFESLKVGMKVRYHEERGEKGAQASSVEVLSTGSQEILRIAS